MSAKPSARDLFLAALERSPADRKAFLDEQCQGDAALRQRVELLLRAHDAPGAFLSEVAPGEAPIPDPPTNHGPDQGTATFGVHPPETASFPGREETIGSILGGRYKLIEEIGEGGMGSVYMAQQLEPVKRAVAVKVIKAGMDSKAVLARFEVERQALAMMDHPNIARVLDAGTTESGRPYFVMELVKGKQITQFCDERKLTPRQRLELFVPVCNAIQHAHHKGIIHRDIKPSNVLVAMYDDRPVPKVIDFGVAKAAGQSLTDKTLMTGFGAIIGTPEYMSPEQANLNNLDIDTRSDVYSLGVLLYELLTGTTPVDRKSLGRIALMEILRIVREVEAPAPSAKLSTLDTLPSVAANRGTEPTKLSRLMRGELDWVLLKALEKDRTRRYDSANGMASDIQRYLADELVEARPPSTGYRLRKFVRRHKGQVVAASLILVALLVGIAGTTWGLIRAEQARQNEQAERQKVQDERDEKTIALMAESKARATARRALDTMTSRMMDDYLARQGALSDSGRTMLNEALHMYEGFAQEKSDDLPSQESVVRAQHQVASILARLGREEEATIAFDRALAGWARLIAEHPTNQDWQIEAVRAEFQKLKLKSLPTLHKPLPEVESELIRSIDRLVHEFPDAPSVRELELEILAELITRTGESLRYKECFAYASRGLNVADQLLAKRPGDARIELRRMRVQQQQRVFQSRAAGEKQTAIEDQTERIAAYERILKSLPGDGDALRGAVELRMNQAIRFSDRREYARAHEEFRHAEAAIAKLISEFPGVPDHRILLGQLYLLWGQTLRQQKSPEAHTIGQLALATWLQLVQRNPENLSLHGGLGGAEMLLAELEYDADHLIAVKEHTDRLLARYDVVEDPNPVGYWAWRGGIQVHALRAAMFVRLWQFEDAAIEWRKCSHCERKLNPKDLTSLVKAWICLARAGKAKIAIAEFQQNVTGGIQNRDLSALDCFNIACVLTLASEQHTADRQSLQDQAATYLTRAWNDGYRDFYAWLNNIDLNPIRTRNDVQRLMGHAEKKLEETMATASSEQKAELRATRAYAWMTQGKYDEAVTEVLELTKSDRWFHGHLYDFACIYAVASTKIPAKKREYADRAMELLKRAIAAGWGSLPHIQNDSDLDSLRSRDDYQQLIQDLQRKYSPQRPEPPKPNP